MEHKEEPGTAEDVILELAIEYVLGNGYPTDLVKDRKRAVSLGDGFYWAY